MGICPLCNGFDSFTYTCHVCGFLLADQGKEMDYYDEYSPYMPIERMKVVNNILHDAQRGQCTHLLHCPQCDRSSIVLIEE